MLCYGEVTVILSHPLPVLLILCNHVDLHRVLTARCLVYCALPRLLCPGLPLRRAIDSLVLHYSRGHYLTSCEESSGLRITLDCQQQPGPILFWRRGKSAIPLEPIAP